MSALYSSSFAGPLPVEAEIEPAVEAGLVAVPTFGDQWPERFRYLQPAQGLFVVDRPADQFEAHRVDFAGRRLDCAFDLLQGECVTGAFVPIALAVYGVKIKPGLVSGSAPVVAFGAGDALHAALAATVRVTMAMEPIRSAAEAAIGGAANFDRPPVRSGRNHWSAPGPASAARNEPHRYRADGSATHHGQDDAA